MSRVRWSLGVVCLAILAACPPPSSPPVVMPAANLGDTTTGVAYSHTITATGGTGALTYSATGLPAGLSIDATSGTIAGIATQAGDFTVRVTATDTRGTSASQDYPLKVYPAPTLTVTVPATANVGSPFSGLLQAAGGKPPITFGVASGQLPPGVTVNSSTGAIGGTPTFAGTFTAVLSATDANGAITTASASIAVLSGAPLSVVTAALPNGVVGTPYLQTLIAQDGQPSYSWSVSSGLLPEGLTLSTSGQLAGTPAAAGTSAFQVTVTDATGQTARRNLAIVVFPPLLVTTPSLPEGYATAAYPATNLAATGGQPPYAWTAPGSLPAGLSFNAATATLSGTPQASAAGSHGLTFVVSDSSGQTRSASYTLEIFALPQVTTTTLADGAVGAPYSQILQASGGKAPLTWAVIAGSLPAGILLDGPSGTLAGTPTTAGTSTFNVRVTDVNGRTASRVLNLSVFDGVVITYGPAPDAYTGEVYSQTLTAIGGRTPYTWTLAGGSLPAGIALDGAAGTLSGTPAVPGSSSFTLRVTDANTNTATRAYTIQTYAPPAITTTVLGNAVLNAPYSQPISATGGKTPLVWAQTGTLPAGIGFNTSTATFAGTAPSTPGSFPGIVVTATDANGRVATQTYILVVGAPPSITTTSVNDAYAGVAFSQALSATGGTGSGYTFAVTAGTLPAGLTLSGAGVLAGTPSGPPGTATFDVTVTDSSGNTGSRSFTQNVLAVPAITTGSPLPDGYRAVAYSQALAVSGGASPYTWSVAAGSLPAGLALGGGTGVISGTPAASGTFNPTITVTDRNGQSASRPFSLTVQPPLAVGTTPLPDGYVGRAYAGGVAASGGLAPYTFSVTSGTLPAGVSMAASGAFSGTPAAPGASSFLVTATDANGTTASQALSIVVYTPPSITSVSYPDAYTAQAYSGSATGAGGKAPLTWSISAGSLPAGLTLDAASGAVTGAATGATQSFTLTLSDANGVTATTPASIAVFALPSITSTSPLGDGYAGQGYTFTFAASGGKAPLTWSLAAGSPPQGLTLASSGALGTAISAGATTGDHSFTVAVSDANGRAAAAPFVLAVYRPPSITTTSLTTATEGVTYLRAPATPEQLAATEGKPPLTFSAGAGLPAGIALSGAGVFSGIPAQGTAGPHPVTFTVADANGMTGTASLDLPVVAARSIYGGGTVGVAPAGSPVTDVLTVFTTDYRGHAYPNLAVRLRRNGLELVPVREQVTDAAGKTVFTGLGLNGTTDTVDVTVNGANVVNTSWQKLNAALVTVPVLDYPLPMPRAYANGEIDPPSGKLLVTGGQNPNYDGFPAVNGIWGDCQNDMLRLADSAAGTWTEDQPPGMTVAPAPRRAASMAYGAAAAAHVLFGGMDCETWTLVNDVWHYSASTATWTPRTPATAVPAARHQAAMGGLPSGQVVLFGGNADPWASVALGDTYVYDPATATWALRTPAVAPLPRFLAGSTAAGNLFWVCGGYDGVLERSDCWSYDAVANAWTSRPAIPTGGRQGPSMTASGTSTVYLFGGASGGATRNDLLVSNGLTWTTPPQANPPPAREGAVLAHEPSTGNLLMFGGRSQSGQIFSDLWSYNPVTGTWTQRAPTYTGPAPTGYTISGTITNGALGSRSRVTIQASGLSGYNNRQIIALSGGTATYSMAEIPAGDTVSLTVLNEDTSRTPYPNRLWSWVDLGVVATNIGSNITRNVALPSGPMTSQLVTVTGSYALPTGYLGTYFSAALARMTRPGYANHPNGYYQVDAVNRTFRSDYFPPSPGTGQTLIPEVASAIAQACEQTVVFLYNVNPGPLAPVVYPPGPRSLTPGLNGCVPDGTGLKVNGTVGGVQPAIGGVAAGDVSRDGIADLVMVNGTDLAVYHGRGSGEGWYDYSPSILIPLGAGTDGSGVGLADFDNNGWLDIAAGLPLSNQVAVALQGPGGTFTTLLWGTAGVSPGSLSVGDVTGDGNADILYGGGLAVGWLRSAGNGSFDLQGTIGTPGPVSALSPVADLDGDGIGDAAYGQPSTNRLGFIRGAAGGPVGSAASLNLLGSPVAIGTGDLDRDGRQDLAVAESPNGLQTFRGIGGFTFGMGSVRTLSAQPVQVAIAELTGDSLRDVIVAQQNSLLVEFNGTGGGAVSQLFSIATQWAPTHLAIGDFNTDGESDVLVGEQQTPGGVPLAETFLARRPLPLGTDTLSFVAPPDTRVLSLSRGPAKLGTDFEVYSRAVAGTNTVSFPLTSALRPSRPAPAGQSVMWSPMTYQASNPANLNMDSFRVLRPRPDAEGFVWGSWLYRR